MRRATTTGTGAAALVLSLLGALLAGTPASAATTGSLLFVRDHDVWIAPAADPAAARALTTDGTADRPYSSPVMDPSGTVYAVSSLGNGVAGSGDIVRLNRSGERIGSPFRPVTTGIIYSLDVAPDGRTLGFTWALSGGSGPIIGVGALSGFARADGSPSGLPTDLEGYQPVFLDDDDALLVSSSSEFSTTGLSTHRLGQPQAQAWFRTCPSVTENCVFPADPDVSEDGRRLAVTTPPTDSIGGDNTRLVVYAMAGAPPSQPSYACDHRAAGEVFEPAWSPDGSALAWEESDGVHLAEGFDAGCAAAFAGERLVLPGATWPSWSSAPATGGSTPPPPGPGGFTDTAGDTHAQAIAALVEAGIAGGYADGTYRPGVPVSRAQMATFLTRALDLPPGDPGAFRDTDGSVHRDAIGSLVAAGITTGYADGTYRPAQSVTRGQMAAFISRGWDLPAGDPSRFSDTVGSTHAAAIGALAESGIAGGYSDGTFRPGQPVTRGQMATFLTRALGL